MLAGRGYSDAPGGQSVTDLLAALQKEKDPGVKAQIISVLGQIGGRSSSAAEKESIVKALIPLMESGPPDSQLAAIAALGRTKAKSAAGPLLELLKQHLGIEDLVRGLADALGEIQDPSAVEILVILFEKHGSPSVRSAAEGALRKIGGPKAEAALKRSHGSQAKP